MLIRLGPFSGMRLREGAELLPDQPSTAERCVNAKFQSGYLEPWRTFGAALATLTGMRRARKVGANWYRWASDAVRSVVPFRVAFRPTQPELITVGEAGGPKWYESPASSGTMNFAGTEAGDLAKPTWARVATTPYEEDAVTITRVYVYTLVNKFGWESGPSTPSTEEEVIEDCDPVLVTIPGTIPAGGKVKLYRSAAGNARAGYFLVDEFSTSTFTDMVGDQQLGALLHTEIWDPMPTDLEGIVSVQGAFFTGWKGTTVAFTIPGEPHAWPTDFYKSLPYRIQAVVPVGGAFTILTEGPTYISSGSDPLNITFYELPTPHFCVAEDSVVVIDNQVLYATRLGIAAVSQSRSGSLPTSSVASPEGWEEWVDPASIRAAYHKGRYVASASKPDGSAFAFCLDPVSGSFSELDAKVVAGVVLPSLAKDEAPEARFVNSAGELRQVEGGSAATPAFWTSKAYVMPKPDWFSMLKVEFDPSRPTLKLNTGPRANDKPEQERLYDAAGNAAEAVAGDVYAYIEARETNAARDPSRVAKLRDATPYRWPPGDRWREVTVDIETGATLKRAYVAQTPVELAGSI